METEEKLENTTFNYIPMVSSHITLIHLIHTYFIYILQLFVNDECQVFVSGNVL